MSGKGGSSLGTFLFSIPLAAIPLMAIFGIPQFAPLGAAPERTDGYAGEPDDRQVEDRYDDQRPYRRRATDVLRARGFDTDTADDELVDRHDSLGHRHEEFQEERDAWPDAAPERRVAEPPSATAFPDRAGDEAPPFREDEQPAPRSSAELLDQRRSGQAAPASSAASETTWQSAARHLQDLGITSYHLEPGSEMGSFLFVCSFCPETSPNVTMRFEAEAIEPLDAVDEVLAQIDHWQQQQSR